MAFGDPMVLETRYNGGAQQVTFDSLLVNGPMDDGTGSWAWVPDVASPVVSTQFGARTGGSGAEYHRLTFSSPGVGDLGYYEQSVTLRGHTRLGNYGHQGRTINGAMYVRRNDATAGSVTATLQILETAVGVSSGTPQILSSGTWYGLSASRTIAALSNTFTLRIKLAYGSGGGGSPVIDVDDAELYRTYTFARNPSMPDAPLLIKPGQTFQRTESGGLVVFGPARVDTARYEYTLNLRGIGQTQLEELRSLWLLDVPMRWTPNLPHLPTYLDVRFSGNTNLRMETNSVTTGRFVGSFGLVEI